MFNVSLSVVIILLATWVFVKWRRIKNYWADRGVPHYKPNIIFGSLTFLQRENPFEWMLRVYNDFNSPYVGMWAFWRPGLVINDPAIARNILVKDHEVFRNRFLSSGKSDPIGALNLFTVNDPTWSFIRRRLTVIFTAAKLRSLNSLVISKANDLVGRIKEEVNNGTSLNLRVLCVDYTTDVIGEAAFGISSESTKTGDSVMRKITRELMEFSLHRGLCWSSIFFFPEMVDIFRFSFFPKKTMNTLREVFRTIIKQRGGYDKKIKESRDLLDALLKIKQEAAAENEEISEDLLLAQAAIFLLGGFDSSGVVLTWCLYELAWNPTYQEKVYREILEAKQKIGDKPLDSSVLAELTYPNCVIKEVLRKFPPMGWLDRIASKDYRIDDKLTIPAGTIVYVNGLGMQLDPKYFPNPEVFDPDRFLPENEINMNPYLYMPFGEGPRGCIDIGTKVEYEIPKTQVNYISRIPSLNSKQKPIIVSFLNRYAKEDFIAAARALKNLNTEDLGYPDTSQRVYINDHLNAESKMLLNKTKEAAKNAKYNYVWVKFGKIHVRKSDTTPSFTINKIQDLNKIA